MITGKNMKSFKIKEICVTFRKYQPQIHQFSHLNIELAILCFECFLGICFFSVQIVITGLGMIGLLTVALR